MTETIAIEVVYALPARQQVIALKVAPGTTAREVIAQSGILQHVADWSFENGKLGVYSRLVTADYIVQDRDRLELYRPLLIDPKEARRQRAKKNK